MHDEMGTIDGETRVQNSPATAPLNWGTGSARRPRAPAFPYERRAHALRFKAAIWRASHVDALRRRLVSRRSSTPRVPSSIEPAGRSSRLRRFFRPAHARAPKLRASHPFGAVEDVLRDFGHHPGGARDLLANGPPLREVPHHQGASGASARRSVDSRPPRARARAPRARRLDPPFRSLPRRVSRPPALTSPRPDRPPRPSSRRRPANAP